MTAQPSTPHFNDIEIRKQAIMVGLSPFMSLDDCMQAARFWEQNYSRSPRFALQKYIRELIDPQHALWPFRHEIFMNVTKITALPRAEVQERFANLFKENLDSGTQAQPQGNEIETRIVFEQLYLALMRLLETEDYPVSVRLRKFVREKMLQEETFNMNTQRLNSWLLGINPQLDVIVPFEKMREVIHAAYRGSCEYLGPVLTDHLLAEAVKEVEKKTRGEGVSPRVFL
jgi:hypothetical protein